VNCSRSPRLVPVAASMMVVRVEKAVSAYEWPCSKTVTAA
jgi:hypothetical protein